MARRLPPLTALRAFEAVARHESLTRAAAELNVSHPALSRHVKELEAWLGRPLFERHNRGLRLTNAGARYRDTLTAALDMVAAATAELAAGAERRRLRLSVDPSFAQRWLARRLARFQIEHPGIEASLDATPAKADFHADADLGIRFGRGPWPGLRSQVLAVVHTFPVGTPALVEGLREPRDLLGRPLLLEYPDEPWYRWLATAGVEGVTRLEGPRFFEAAHALDAAADGQGIALGDLVLSGDELAAGRLVRPFPVEIPQDAFHLVAPPEHFRRPEVSAFVAWVKGEMAAHLRQVGGEEAVRVLGPGRAELG
ncbi:transcriptional regulator GcvA [Aerophototrophica crusticola]|uniref:Transcriptional regulator GcvA n=1 Tax=Aerophototrophica crusticola TaxID=1709002 RepID=A0A858R851_9PROT|nr:transcriptional regulator GcvA [Rhodospirillaceae bacterium B3]